MEKEVILPSILKKVREEWEDSLVKTWRTCTPIAPKMLLDFKVAIVETYASTVGLIIINTPFWRGKTFTNAITRHEFLHYSLYPLDIFRGLNDLTLARQQLKDQLTPEEFKTYSIGELQFIENVLGDYLIHLQMQELNKDEWEVMWNHLLEGGKFQADKVKDRDTTFQLYISAYHWMNNDIPEFQVSEKESMEKAQKIADIVLKARKGIVTKPFALKELALIFHSYIKEDEQKGKGEENNEEPKCPQCKSNDWEVVEVLKEG